MTHVEAAPMVMSWFAILLLVGLIGLLVLILGNRGARRVLAGLAIGVAVVVVFGLLAMFWARSSVHYSTSSPSLFSEAVYPPEDEAMESHAVRGVAIGTNGVVVREGRSSIVVNGSGVSVTGGQSIDVSRNGVVVQQNGADRSLSPSTAARDQAAREVARVAEEVRAVADEVRAISSHAGSRPARALASKPPVVPQPPVAPDPAPAVRPGEAAATGSVTDEWIDAGQADFEADVYPSEQSAAVALARKAIKSWDRVLPDGQEPTQVLIRADNELEPAVVPAVLQTLRAKLGDDRVEMDKSPQEAHVEEVERVLVSPDSAPALPEADATVRLAIGGSFSYVGGRDVIGSFSYSDGRQGVVTPQKSGGTIEVVLSGPTGKRTHTAAFVNKHWVEYGIDRASQLPGQERMVARSKRLCPTRGEAEQQAIADAADKLVPLVSIAIERLDAAGKNEPLPGITTMRRLQSAYNCAGVIRADLLRGSGVKDQFTQQLRKPYGDVWQHAVLIDASDRRITSYAQTFMSQITQEHTAVRQWRAAWIGRALGLGLLTVLIVVLYAFLNAATRGYYTWMLRGSMVLLVLAGAVVLLLMA